jgi:phospholipase C
LLTTKERSFLSRVLLSCFCGLLPLLLFTGCTDLQVNAAPDPSVTLSASPASIAQGGSSTLTVKAVNAIQLTLTGSDGSSYNLQANGGTQVVAPNETTTYTATAKGFDESKSVSEAVKVTPAGAPTVSIVADPASIDAGKYSMLTVAASNATEVTLTGSNGSKYTLKGDGGAQAVDPAETTTYTATASGPGGKASAMATVTVGSSASLSVSISANPALIDVGDSSTLTVTANKATDVTLSGTNGARYTLHADGGTQVVKPEETTAYTATASADGKTVTAVATVTVRRPLVKIAAFPAAIEAGHSSLLTVIATSATAVILTGTNGSKYTLTATGGKEAVSPKTTTTYTATASSAEGKNSASVTVTVSANPVPTVKITANPESIKAGSSSTLTVSAVHSTSVVVTGSDGSKYTLKPSGGTQSVHPARTTTYTATAMGPGGKASDSTTVTVTPVPKPTVSIVADPAAIVSGNSSTLTITATNAAAVKVTGGNGTTYTLGPDGGSQAVSPTATTIYEAEASGPGGTASASTTVTVNPPGSIESVDHVIFMLQENHTFDNYFGMLNPYRKEKGWNIGDDGNTYNVDGIDDKLNTISDEDDEGTSYSLFKLASTCIDDDSSDWLASYGDVNRYDFLTSRPIQMNGFVHTGEGYAKSCSEPGATCSGAYTDLTGQRAMGYYDQGFLNYYYYMASQFALSDRWFSPVASKSIDNRIATFTGGTTQGLVKDPGNDDHLGQLNINNIFEELDQANVSWKIYYTVTQGFCLEEDDCPGSASAAYPATDFSSLSYSYRYLYENPSGGACTPPTQPSSVVGDSSNSFCIDPDKITPVSTFFSDLANGTLPSFAFIEAGYGRNDEHPGSGQSILLGQAQVANILDSFMSSPEWNDSIFFLGYDEGGGPYEHVPPVPGHSNDNTDASLGTIPDISQIAVNPDTTPSDPTQYFPCVPPSGTPTLHCDLSSTDPGANSGDAAAANGFAAQLGFRIPNMIVSPFTRRHYVSHIPMDHTAVIKFVENRFIGSAAHLTNRDAAQPNLLDFFDFDTIPWASPPTPPTPVSDDNTCTPANMGP